MANTLTIRGFVSSGLELRNTQTGIVVGNFRMGSTHRKQDPVTNAWIDGDTNWFRVNVFRTLAQNAASSIHKGDRVIVVGKLNISTYFRKDGSTGVSVEIDAESVGPDLQFGTAHYSRMSAQSPAGNAASQQGEESSSPYPPLQQRGGNYADNSGEADSEFANQDETEADTDQTGGDGEVVNTETGEIGNECEAEKEPAPF